MFSFFKRKSKYAEMIIQVLKTLWFPPLTPDFIEIEYKELNTNIKNKVLLFSYGIVDSFCQGASLSKEDSLTLFTNIDFFFIDEIGESLKSFMTSGKYKEAFNDSSLREIIILGGKTYSDFASKDPKKGGFALTRLNSLISLWKEM